MSAGAPSISSRFLVSAASNAGRAVLLLGASVLLARSLGAAEYGRLQFLLAVSLAARQLLDMGSSSAFFTLSSGGAFSLRVAGAYAVWLVVQLAATLAATWLAWPLLGRAWLGEPRDWALLALTAVFLQEAAWGMVMSLGESARRTALVQLSGLAATALYFALVALSAWAGRLTVARALVFLAVSYALASAVAGARLIASSEPVAEDQRTTLAAQLRFYSGFWTAYAVTSAAGFAASFADAWLLQRHGGAEQQAYYGVSLQLSAAALLATISFLKVFWKEIAEALARGDLDAARDLYAKTTRLLYLATCVACAPMAALAPEIVRLALGEEYRGAAVPFAIMCLFPLGQTLGQLNNSFLLAGARTREYAAMTVAVSALGIVAAYLLLAVLGLGAVGAPIRQVAVCFIGVSIQRVVIARLYGWPLEWSFQWRYAALFLLPAAALAAGARACFEAPWAVVLAASAGYAACLAAAARWAGPFLPPEVREAMARLRGPVGRLLYYTGTR